MDVLQAWLLVGVPGLVIVAALFVGHSRVRAYAGYILLAAIVGVFLAVDGGAISAGIIGMVAVALVATSQGSPDEADRPEHHQTRDRFTHVTD
ncbi:hypothetical protein [Salsipaludibacter albus]|uniref:hypothetical protein n=1 Tax=Salsipaludibacter albus TaxID=2849650 RepID=UPI001EE4D912|nr:hypothetical protein [Salsipaludibacter albus]MBY5163508.1 hypothetical protein [Salsipaludibacter albus]